MNLQFGVQGFGVCAVAPAAERCGHFSVQLLVAGRAPQALDLAQGATQATVQLPVGRHRLRLRFVDGASQRELLPAVEHSLPVVGQERM